jgi:hypothetical protein
LNRSEDRPTGRFFDTLAIRKQYEYHSGMVSAENSEGSPSMHSKQLEAIKQFELELDALMYPVGMESLKMVTKNLLMRTFDYGPREADARIAMLDESGNFPTDNDLELEDESSRELLKTCLYDELAEDYYLQYGQGEFDRWIEPYLRSVLHGHLSDSPSSQHLHECLYDPGPENPGPFCPAVVMRRMVKDMLCEGRTPIEQNIGYRTHSEELVHINVMIVRTLHKLGIYSELVTEKILDKYMNWLESEEEPLSYEAELFDL